MCALRKKQAAAAAKCASKKAAPKQAHAGEKRPLQPGGAGAANARPPGMCRICGRCDAGHTNARASKNAAQSAAEHGEDDLDRSLIE